MRKRKDFRLWDEAKRGPSTRPFRLWDANKKVNVAHRCYTTSVNAENAALIMMRWAKIGMSLEVYQITTGKLIAQYSRRVVGVAVTK